MADIFSWDWWQALFGAHRLWIMFASAFLSATVLPGNSEIIFLTIAAPLRWSGADYFSADIPLLLLVAVFGNTLGGMTTYILGRWLPALPEKQHKKQDWVLDKTQRYGSMMLFFSWVPVVGDLFCAVAGWLQLNWISCLIFMMLGKIVRYILLLFLGTAWL